MADLAWARQRKLLRAPDIGFNAEVFRHFKTFDDTPGRLALRDSLLIGTKDSRTTALFKIQYFRDQVQKVHLSPSIVGVTKGHFDLDFETPYKPIVQLYFQQDRSAVVEDYAPVTAEISFRLMDESTESITKQNLQVLATKIKNEFALGQGYTFNKGKLIVYYLDKKLGYDFRLRVINEAEGIQVIKKVLDIQNHSYNDDLIRTSSPKKASVNTTTIQTIAGRPYRRIRWRPTAVVRFQWSSILIHGTHEALYLVDRTLSRPYALETIY